MPAQPVMPACALRAQQQAGLGQGLGHLSVSGHLLASGQGQRQLAPVQPTVGGVAETACAHSADTPSIPAISVTMAASQNGAVDGADGVTGVVTTAAVLPPWHIPAHARVLLIPGWQRSLPPASWWQQAVGHVAYQQVLEQHDWHMPRRGDWLAQLQQAMLDLAPQPEQQIGAAPVWLVAHGLGCALLRAWAACSPLARAAAAHTACLTADAATSSTAAVATTTAVPIQGVWLIAPVDPTQPEWASRLPAGWQRPLSPLAGPASWPVWVWGQEGSSAVAARPVLAEAAVASIPI